MADHYGRRPFMFVFILGLIGAMLGIVIGQNLPSLIVAGAIRGLTDCSVPVIPSVIGDVMGDDDLMGRRFGQLGAAMGLGAIVGPAIAFGATFISTDRRLPFILAVALGVINGICTLIWVKETNENRGMIKSPFRPGGSGRALETFGNRLNPFKVFKIFKESPFSFLLALSLMFINISFSGILVVLFLYTHYQFHWTERQNGLYLLLFGFLASITQVSVLPLVLPKHRWGEKITAYVGTVSYIGGLILLGAAWIDWFLYVIACIASLGFIMAPALRGAMSDGVEANRQGELQGASALLDAIAQVGGPFALSAVFSFFISDQSPLDHPLPGAPFYFSAGLQVISTVFMTVAFGCCLHTRKQVTSMDDILPKEMSDPTHPPSPRTISIIRAATADEQKETHEEPSRSNKKEASRSKRESMKSNKSHRKSKNNINRDPRDRIEDGGKVTLDLNVLRSPHAPKVAVHPDPNSESPFSSRGGSPEHPRILPRVHGNLDELESPAPGPANVRRSEDNPLKIHDHEEDRESAMVELSSLDLKHTPQRKISGGRGGGVGIPYETNSYSSSQQMDRGFNESIDNRHYGGGGGGGGRVEENDSDEERKARLYGGGQQLMIPAGDRYIAVRTSSMDEREVHEQSNSKLKIHLSEDENEAVHHYHVNHN
jgi:DHA1 family tetracycline resistance protein-like MFS transporter